MGQFSRSAGKGVDGPGSRDLCFVDMRPSLDLVLGVRPRQCLADTAQHDLASKEQPLLESGCDHRREARAEMGGHRPGQGTVDDALEVLGPQISHQYVGPTFGRTRASCMSTSDAGTSSPGSARRNFPRSRRFTSGAGSPACVERS